LVDRQYLVIYLHKYPSYESVDLNLKICHPNLIARRFSGFSVDEFLAHLSPGLQKKKLGVLVELPNKVFLPALERMKRQGATIVYDLLDDWSTSLGASWYSPQAEMQITQLADCLIATTADLAQHLEAQSGKRVQVVPNAVNPRLFNPGRLYDRPPDLPATTKPLVLYSGALWGEWFDWTLLISLAKHFPQLSFVMIGDYRGQCPESLPNLFFLGLKPQAALPAYLSCAQVTMIPWKINQVSQATSPLKVYEYLAMHKPVVAPDLAPLAGLPYVFRSQNVDAFISNIETALHVGVNSQEVDEFISRNTWQARVNQIIEWIS
jgi:glycosyltransferase involved in cell wall biosynthesis